MAPGLQEVSRTKKSLGNLFISQVLVVEDYDANPRLCRRGVWVGVRAVFEETVVLSFEHDGEVESVGWKVDDTWVGGPGFPRDFVGNPPVEVRSPVDGLSHHIALVSRPRNGSTCVNVQAVYSLVGHPGDLHDGPSQWVCLSGSDPTLWPQDKLAEEARCLKAFQRRLEEALPRFPRLPYDQLNPVTTRLARLGGEPAKHVEAIPQTLERVDVKEERDFAVLLEAEMLRLLSLEHLLDDSSAVL